MLTAVFGDANARYCNFVDCGLGDTNARCCSMNLTAIFPDSTTPFANDVSAAFAAPAGSTSLYTSLTFSRGSTMVLFCRTVRNELAMEQNKTKG